MLPSSNESFRRLASQPGHTGHIVQFYEDEQFLASVVADFLAEGLGAGQPAVVIATESHREAFVERLGAVGVPVENVQRDGRLVCLDARRTLADFMVGSMPDERRFASTIGGVLESSLRGGGKRVYAYGEMVDLLWRDDNPAAAIRLEELWNELARHYSFSLLCAYSMSSFYKQSHAHGFQEICRLHEHVVPMEPYTGGDEQHRAREVTLLQQKARALETEIKHRAEMEGALREALAERRRAQEQLHRLASIVQSSDDAIVSKNLDGVITSWNPGAERTFGYTAAESIGQSILMIIPADRREEENEVLSRIRRGEIVDHFETIRRRRDGSEVAVSLTVSPIKDASGRIVGASKIARDITERKSIEAERERLLAHEQLARGAAEQANRVKDEFLAMLSHELRTPLNAILGWTQLAASRERQSATTLRQALDVIQRNGELQLRLIDELLDISKIASGKMQLSTDAVDLATVVNTAGESLRPAAAAKSIEFDVRADEPGPMVTGDASRLQQVVWNLLSNAIKFTPEGGRVGLRLETAGTVARITVSDTGEGMSSDFLPYVFDRFRQADAATTRKYGGLGLGLSVARYLIEAHGGGIVAHSPGKGHGSTFTVTLPASVVPSALDYSGQESPVALDGIRLLVLDDDEDARYLLSCMLELRGARVTTARSADEVLGLLTSTTFDVLLADLGMPGQDGYELIELIRRHPLAAVRQIKAVAVTAYAAAEHRTKALALGYDGYLVKPVAVNRLGHVIVRMLASTADAPVLPVKL